MRFRRFRARIERMTAKPASKVLALLLLGTILFFGVPMAIALTWLTVVLVAHSSTYGPARARPAWKTSCSGCSASSLSRRLPRWPSRRRRSLASAAHLHGKSCADGSVVMAASSGIGLLHRHGTRSGWRTVASDHSL